MIKIAIGLKSWRTFRYSHVWRGVSRHIVLNILLQLHMCDSSALGDSVMHCHIVISHHLLFT